MKILYRVFSIVLFLSVICTSANAAKKPIKVNLKEMQGNEVVKLLHYGDVFRTEKDLIIGDDLELIKYLTKKSVGILIIDNVDKGQEIDLFSNKLLSFLFKEQISTYVMVPSSRSLPVMHKVELLLRETTESKIKKE